MIDPLTQIHKLDDERQAIWRAMGEAKVVHGDAILTLGDAERRRGRERIGVITRQLDALYVEYNRERAGGDYGDEGWTLHSLRRGKLPATWRDYA